MCDSNSPSQERDGQPAAQHTTDTATPTQSRHEGAPSLSVEERAELLEESAAAFETLDDYDRAESLAALARRAAADVRDHGAVATATRDALFAELTETAGDLADNTDGTDAVVARELFELLGVIGAT
ncbi:hypothetical protein RYH80_12835 [Halobaculum sp. MBLA0147]|uniref:hypothetical protein n=1 Tax=Halobaculum sp. MBLA0147 TaxID=3079934 RepID=UPI00352622C1